MWHSKMNWFNYRRNARPSETSQRKQWFIGWDWRKLLNTIMRALWPWPM
jgi:hypothetical protein